MTPFLVGIAGGSGSGKSWLARGLREALGERCVHVAHDAYYRSLPEAWIDRSDDWNFDEPAAVESDLLARHLAALRAGASVDVPTYAFDRHARVGTEPLAPAPVVLVEGILLFAEPALVGALDLRVFVDAPEEVRFERRLTRDVRERGRTEASVLDRLARLVRPMHDRHVAPSRGHADLVVDGRDPLHDNLRRVLARLPPELG